jgi:CheY-like chemotaxis protein
MARSSTPPILILDDELQWRGVLSQALTEAGFSCRAVGDGEEAVEIVRRDFGQKIKLVLTDELLLVEPDNPNSDKQHCQGCGVRKDIHELRPDIQFIVISDVPRQVSLEYQDPEQAAIAALAKKDELSDGPEVFAMVDKIGLKDLKTSQDRYAKLIQKIRSVLGGTKDKNIKPPALFISLGIDPSEYEKLETAAGIKKGDDFRLYKHVDKSGSNRRGIEVEKFLKQNGFKDGIKAFLEILVKEGSGGKDSTRSLNNTLDKEGSESKNLTRNPDNSLVKCISIQIRKPNKTLVLAKDIKVGSSEFRVFFMLAYRAEKGETPLIRERDYVFEQRKGQATDLGMGIGEDTLRQAMGATYDDEDYDPDEFLGNRHELVQRQVAEDIAYEIDKFSGRRKQKAEISKPQSKLKAPVTRTNKYLKAKGLGEIVHNSSDKLSAYYEATYTTGIILYPVDPDTIPAIPQKKSTKTRLRK